MFFNSLMSASLWTVSSSNSTCVAFAAEVAVGIPYVGNASTHTGTKVSSGRAKNNHSSAGHVFATMVPDPFNNSVCTAIAYTESFSGYSPEVGFTRGRAVKHNITDQHVVFSGEAAVGGWINDDLSTGEPLADIVVCITLDSQL